MMPTLSGPVLVVDDDPIIRMTTADMIENAGMTALTAGSADEALAVLQNQLVAAVVTDVVMPGTLDGLGLVSWLRRRWPQVAVVVTSGHMPFEAAGNAADTKFLQKPVSAPDLITALASQAHAVA